MRHIISIVLVLIGALVLGCVASTSTTAPIGPRRMGLTSATDPNNCGTVGTVCGIWNIQSSNLISMVATQCVESSCNQGTICTAAIGGCQYSGNQNLPLKAGNQVCNGVGTNVVTDSSNCGKCGHVCFNSACQYGQCYP